MTGAVDHVVVNVLEQMDEAAAWFRAIGFTLTERGHHSLGSINHLMMFADNYLEVVGIEPSAATVRREVAESPIGLNGLVFASDNARGLHRALLDAGVPVLPPMDFDRPVHVGTKELRARFTTARIEPGFLAGGRIYFCEHKTPELVWRPEWQQHRNTALGLERLTIVVPDPAQEAHRYQLLPGCEVQARDAQQVEIRLDSFCIELCTVARYQSRYGSLGCSDSRGGTHAALPRPAFMGALAIRTASLQSARDCLVEAAAMRELISESSPEHIVVSAACAYDCVLEFV